MIDVEAVAAERAAESGRSATQERILLLEERVARLEEHMATLEGAGRRIIVAPPGPPQFALGTIVSVPAGRYMKVAAVIKEPCWSPDAIKVIVYSHGSGRWSMPRLFPRKHRYQGSDTKADGTTRLRFTVPNPIQVIVLEAVVGTDNPNPTEES